MFGFEKFEIPEIRKKRQTTKRIEGFNTNVSVDIGIVFKRKDKTQKGLKIK